MSHSARIVGGLVHIRVQMRPALRWEELVTQYFELKNAPDKTGDEMAALLLEYSAEIAI
jgi:hypothetical protein